MAVATIGHTAGESSFCSQVIGNKAFDLARNGHLKISGFPDFKQSVQELQKVEPPPQPNYSVSVPLGQALLTKECLVDEWQQKTDFCKEFEVLLAAHDQEFNPKKIKRSSETLGQSPSEPPTKRLCIQADPLNLNEFETKFPNRLGHPNNPITLNSCKYQNLNRRF